MKNRLWIVEVIINKKINELHQIHFFHKYNFVLILYKQYILNILFKCTLNIQYKLTLYSITYIKDGIQLNIILIICNILLNLCSIFLVNYTLIHIVKYYNIYFSLRFTLLKAKNT